jgi:hypothetical protein
VIKGGAPNSKLNLRTAAFLPDFSLFTLSSMEFGFALPDNAYAGPVQIPEKSDIALNAVMSILAEISGRKQSIFLFLDPNVTSKERG